MLEFQVDWCWHSGTQALPLRRETRRHRSRSDSASEARPPPSRALNSDEFTSNANWTIRIEEPSHPPTHSLALTNTRAPTHPHTIHTPHHNTLMLIAAAFLQTRGAFLHPSFLPAAAFLQTQPSTGNWKPTGQSVSNHG